MGRLAKPKPPSIKGLPFPKLYHGTSERIAKLASHSGIVPYDVEEAADRVFSDTKNGLVYLTNTYPGQMAFAHSNLKERWGVIEVNVAALDLTRLFPSEDALSVPRRKPLDPRRRILKSKMKWTASVSTCGLCTYAGAIPASAISRIAIYSPYSNWLVTKSILHAKLGRGAYHLANLKRNIAIVRWLMAEGVTSEEWLSDKYVSASIKEREEVMSALVERSGLDIFYHGS